MAKISSFFPRLYLPLLLLLAAAYAWRPLEGGNDFWAHAAVGRWIWANGRVPYESLFIWTYPDWPWIAHSWLSQLLFYIMLREGGPLAVVVFNVAMPVVVFFLLWRTWKLGAQTNFFVPLLFAIAIWVSAPRYQPRQELISALFLTVLLAFLAAWWLGRFDDWLRRNDGAQISLMAAPLVSLFFFWVNLHALVAVGLGVLWIAALGDLAQTWISKSPADRSARGRARALLLIAILCTFAVLINPYGIDYWRAAEQLRPGNMARSIEEWKPFWLTPVMNPAYPIAECILFCAALAAWLSHPQRRWAHMGWLLFAATLFMRSRRMLWMAAIIFLVVAAVNASTLDTPTLWRSWRRLTKGNILDPIPDGMRFVMRGGVIVVLLVWLAAAASRHNPAEAGDWSTLVRNVPEGAARKILTGKLPRRIFNDYEDSSYLQWRLNSYIPGSNDVPERGRYPLFTDLLNAYPDRLMDEYLAILDATPEGLKYFQNRHIDCVVLGDHLWSNPVKKIKWGLYDYLQSHPKEWRQIFKDKQSIIWVRAGSTRAAL
jgi:hypothetical protein